MDVWAVSHNGPFGMLVGPSDNEEASCVWVTVQYVFFLSYCYLLYVLC